MVISLRQTKPPKNEAELIQRCQCIEGLTFSQLSIAIGITIPNNAHQRKGWVGQAIEIALGATGSNRSEPDFIELGIELKTLPLSKSSIPSESTFIVTIPLLTIHQQTWSTSQCFAKLKRVLWIPIEGDVAIPYEQRRIGKALLWSPNPYQAQALEADWSFLTSQISLGYLDSIDASYGEYLQVRPKGANAKSLCYAYDSDGNKIKTLPRGFYLRAQFTSQIIAEVM